MKKKFRAGICLFLSILACLCIFTGCGGSRYHATLYSKAQEWVDEEFLKEHRVYGAAYKNENYVEGESDWDEEYIWDESSPRTHTFIISTQEEYRQIFSKSTVEVDFEKKTVILYIFSDVYPREYKLKNMKLKDGILEVYCKLAYSNKDDSCMPYQRCFMLVLNKVDFETVEFIEK